MSSAFTVSEDVEQLVKNIITKHNWDPLSEVKYQRGSEVGDGYASKTIAVEIANGNGIMKLFLKCILNIKRTDAYPIDKFYNNEIHFYEVIYPAYRKFLIERGVTDGFTHVPKCYGTLEKQIVALENIKASGFCLFDRTQAMNDSHITLVLKTLAKFHAVSFSLKHQDRETYHKLLDNIQYFIDLRTEELPFEKRMRATINEVLVKLDPIEDKDILDKCNVEDLLLCIRSSRKCLNEYSILTQGDCWCNNLMFLYEADDSENPVDIMLIDWQLIRPASTVFDISFFFYAIASEESLSKLDHYLKIYHEELSEQIGQMGSDPDVAYPYEIFVKEWKQHCKYGFVLTFLLLKLMLASKDEAFDMETVDFDNVGGLYPNFEMEDEYIRRMRILAKFLIKNDYL